MNLLSELRAITDEILHEKEQFDRRISGWSQANRLAAWEAFISNGHLQALLKSRRDLIAAIRREVPDAA